MNGRPTDAGHGALVRFSLIPVDPDEERHDIDWTALAHLTDARPVYYRCMRRTITVESGELVADTDSGPICDAHGFGYQYRDASGENVQVVEEVT